MKRRALLLMCVAWGLAVGITGGLFVFTPATANAQPPAICKGCVLL